MLDIVRRETARKWMIACALATHQVLLAQITKTHMSVWDSTRVFSSDKTIACVAHGFDLASCQNHNENQALVVDVADAEPVLEQIDGVNRTGAPKDMFDNLCT